MSTPLFRVEVMHGVNLDQLGSRDPAQIRASCEASLRRLQTDCIAVYQFHGGWYDPDDVAAILDHGGLETLRALREEGKIRFLGFTAEAPTGGVSELIATGAFDVVPPTAGGAPVLAERAAQQAHPERAAPVGDAFQVR